MGPGLNPNNLVCETNESNIDICDEHNTLSHFSIVLRVAYRWYRPLVTDEALKRYIIPHHVHIGSHLAYFFLNYVDIGTQSAPCQILITRENIASGPSKCNQYHNQL